MRGHQLRRAWARRALEAIMQRVVTTTFLGLVLSGLALPASKEDTGQERAAQEDKSRKPALSIRASPPISFSPARVRAIAELKGGPDDSQDYYCLSVEWDWGDQTRSEESNDCEPYEPGVSQIARRFSGEHTYHFSGKYRVTVRLKRNNKVVVAANTIVQVRPGLRDIGN
jgi:hypothetical protein